MRRAAAHGCGLAARHVQMEHSLDPGYLGHAGSARITGVAALRLANADILPFRYSDYAAAVSTYVTELQEVPANTPRAADVDLTILLEAAEAWGIASERLEARADELLAAGDTSRPGRAGRSRASTTR